MFTDGGLLTTGGAGGAAGFCTCFTVGGDIDEVFATTLPFLSVTTTTVCVDPVFGSVENVRLVRLPVFGSVTLTLVVEVETLPFTNSVCVADFVPFFESVTDLIVRPLPVFRSMAVCVIVLIPVFGSIVVT